MWSLEATFERPEPTMEATILIFTVLLVLVAFDLAAVLFGVDSRDPIGDDHQRPVALSR
jgi:hypothetical protein